MNSKLIGSADRRYSDDPAGWIAECIDYNPMYRKMIEHRAEIDESLRTMDERRSKIVSAARKLRHHVQADALLEGDAADALADAIEANTTATDDGSVEIDQSAILRDFLNALEQEPKRKSQRGKRRTTPENDLAVFIYNNAFEPRGIRADDAVEHIAAYLTRRGAGHSVKKAAAKRIREHFRHCGLLAD